MKWRLANNTRIMTVMAVTDITDGPKALLWNVWAKGSRLRIQHDEEQSAPSGSRPFEQRKDGPDHPIHGGHAKTYRQLT